MTPDLAGWRVLVPRGGEWGERVAGMLHQHGAESVVVPLIEFAPPQDLTPFDSVLNRLARGDYDWLVVTSATTVQSLSGRVVTLVNRGRETPATALATFVGDTSVAAVGPGTARALERAAVTPSLVPTGERSARGLLAEFPRPEDVVRLPGRPGRVLLPQSDLAEPTLADGLRGLGWEVDVVVAYRTLSGPVPGEGLRTQVRTGEFDAVLLSSASTVANLLELVGTPPPTTVVCCIGPRTEQAAREHGLPVHVVPAQASGEELVDALAAYAAGRAPSAPPGVSTAAPPSPRPPEES
ncbi:MULTISPECIES: uroporphyrinogen-III synthase [unclassified Actinotalea]|uniref:uroporphyrinogen-III synthase n=1 Tax=unclassified Actinotalea TaxID=2638618 RepID=UPI0015F58F9E|nr:MULTISPECIES: uroporphyrinogen-III synthase [unclassified Actinotalea]